MGVVKSPVFECEVCAGQFQVIHEPRLTEEQAEAKRGCVEHCPYCGSMQIKEAS